MNRFRMAQLGSIVAGMMLLAPLAAGCASGDSGAAITTSNSSRDTASSDTASPDSASPDTASPDHTAPLDDTASSEVLGAPNSTDSGAKPAPLPPLPNPAPALACDGFSVLCVDAAAGAGSPVGTTAQPFATIGAAIDAAAPGTTIEVAIGTYAEPVVFNGISDINLVGGFAAGGDFSSRDAVSDETVLQGTDDASVVAIVGATGIRVEGFHITGGGGSTDTYAWFGGGVHIDESSSDVQIVGNRIDSNAVDHGDDPATTFGGGIASYGMDVSIIANVIADNSAGRGSGISAQGKTTIQGNIVRNNVSAGDHGGGMYLYGDVTVLGNHVEGNRVGDVIGYGWGGGIIVYGDDTIALLQANVVTGNSAVTAGSGVFIDDGADAMLIGELYYANACTSDGGAGLLVDSGDNTATEATLTNVTIAQHDCPNSNIGGQAVLAERSGDAVEPPLVTVMKSILWGNRGSDVLSLGAEITVTNSDIEDGTSGGGNISEDPLFADPASGDFSLDASSPAIGLGAK